MSAGIYKYTNRLNGNVYIGQSDNIEKRYTQHLYDVTHPERKGTGIDIAMRADGIENFDFEIIELCDKELLDEREIFWIGYYDSYNNGYNRTIGGSSLRGEEHPRAILTEEEVYDIREQYGQGIRRSEVFKPYIERGISERTLLKIWNNENWCTVHQDVYTEENKALHKAQVGHSEDQIGLSSFDRAIKQADINLWVTEFNNGMTINAIAKKYNRDNGTIEKYINNPKALIAVKYKGRKVQNVETQEIFDSISKAAKWAGCGATTLTRHLTSDKIAGKVPGTENPAHWVELS